MNLKSGIIVGALVLSVISGGIYISMGSSDEPMVKNEKIEKSATQEQKMIEEKAMVKKDTTEEESMLMNEEVSVMEKDIDKVNVGTYEVYAPEKIALASTNHDVVLFFRASWCPSCRAIDADIKANLEEIPLNLTILDVDYDEAASLKQKYGVTYQHTFVQVDSSGTLMKKWSGSPTLTALIGELK